MSCIVCLGALSICDCATLVGSTMAFLLCLVVLVLMTVVGNLVVLRHILCNVG